MFSKSCILILCYVAVTVACATGDRYADKLKEELGKKGWPLGAYPSFFDDSLSLAEVRSAGEILVAGWREGMKKRYEKVWQRKSFIRAGLQMRFDYHVFGEMPKDGRSLYISLHGGGNCASSVNTQQWHNQIRLYQPKEGVYVAPRAPWDDWDMWFKPGMDEFLEELIASAVVLEGVNPNRVYLMGYSAGGDGVWRLAPRMADRWAAASMMAGHPGEASQVNLRNVPYMIWMGENDSAYDRNRLAVERGRVLDSLKQGDPGGYVHETHIVKGKGHWMDREDAAAVPWMATYSRDPYPGRVVWRQENLVRSSMYWLKVEPKDARPGMRVDAVRRGNTIEIERCDYDRIVVCLNDEMMNLDKPVTVMYKGKTLFSGTVKRTIGTLCRSLEERGDSGLMFSAEIEVPVLTRR